MIFAWTPDAENIMIDIKKTKNLTSFIFSSLTALPVAANLTPNAHSISKLVGNEPEINIHQGEEKVNSNLHP
jgi:hypothetical protein